MPERTNKPAPLIPESVQVSGTGTLAVTVSAVTLDANSQTLTLGVSVPTPLPTIPGYEILEVLGRGGMGIVYKARQIGLDRLVAIKMIVSGEFADPQAQARFLTEGEAIARLRHPNIVQIFDVGQHEGSPYFSLELVEGGSLARRLDGTPQAEDATLRLAATLADAVHAAHLAGIVHRDLKPGNVLPRTVVPKRSEPCSEFALLVNASLSRQARKAANRWGRIWNYPQNVSLGARQRDIGAKRHDTWGAAQAHVPHPLSRRRCGSRQRSIDASQVHV